MGVQIKRYKVTTWLNKETNTALYGVKVFVVGSGWCDVAEDGKGVFFDTKREAEFYILDMKGERSKAGFKRVAAATPKSDEGGIIPVGAPAQMQESNDCGLAHDDVKPEDTTQGDRPARPATYPSAVTSQERQP